MNPLLGVRKAKQWVRSQVPSRTSVCVLVQYPKGIYKIEFFWIDSSRLDWRVVR